MGLEERVMQILGDSVQEVNEQTSEENRMDFRPETPLIGERSPLDSLGLVSLIVAVEGGVSREFDVGLALVDVDAMKDPSGAFRDLGALRDHIVRLLREQFS